MFPHQTLSSSLRDPELVSRFQGWISERAQAQEARGHRMNGESNTGTIVVDGFSVCLKWGQDLDTQVLLCGVETLMPG